MKKSLLILFNLLLPVAVLAQTIPFQNPLTYNTFGELVDKVVDFVFIFSAGVVPLMIIIGSFYILTAGGDSKKVANGRTIITYTLIGFAIILFAKGLISIIEQVIGVKIGG